MCQTLPNGVHTCGGPNYLQATGTPLANDESTFYPPDFNDDNKVDQTDLAWLNQYVGQGNGVDISRMDVNSGPQNYGLNTFPWRRFDLDGDGYVNGHDVDIVTSLIGTQPGTTNLDKTSPTSVIRFPSATDTIYVGSQNFVKVYGWDNLSLSKVECFVNGRKIGEVQVETKVSSNAGFPGTTYDCLWKVPMRADTYTLQTKATDGAGNIGLSDPVTITTQK